MFAATERLEFEALLNKLRLVFLVSVPLVLLSQGPSASPFAALIGVVTLGSYVLVDSLLARRSSVLLRHQLALRTLDCVLILSVLHPYHGSFGNAYYDSVYLLFVIAAAATHGLRGGLVIALVAGGAVLFSRMVHVQQGTFPVEMRHLTDSAFYTLFFATIALAVAYLMRASAVIVARAEAERRADLSAHAKSLAELNWQLAQAVEERDRSLEAREEFIAVASHELRNPLTSLHGTIDLARHRLERDGQLAPEYERDAMDRLHRQSTRLVQLVQRVFDVSRLSTGQLELDVAPMDLAEIVRGLVTDFERANPHYDVVFQAPDQIATSGDAVRLQQVLSNLLSNAVKFSPAESAIEVELSIASEAKARIHVRDHGPGVSPEHRQQIFERYYQAGPRAGRGLGLGLYLSRQIMESHGGTLRAEFPGDGGTRMVIELPLTPASETTTHLVTPAVPATAGEPT